MDIMFRQLSESKIRNLIRQVIEEVIDRRNVLHPSYAPGFKGDVEDARKIDILSQDDPDYGAELYDILDVPRGSIFNPRKMDIEQLDQIASKIKNEDLPQFQVDLHAYLEEGIIDAIRHELINSKLDPRIHKWWQIKNYFNNKTIIDDIREHAVSKATSFSFHSYPEGNRDARKYHIVKVGSSHSSLPNMLSTESIREEIKFYYEGVMYGY